MTKNGKLRTCDGKMWLVLSVPQLIESFILPSLSVLFTYLVTYNLIIFMLIRSFNAWQGFNFVIVFAELLPLLIYLIFVISFLLYDYYKHIKSIINHFFVLS